MLLTWGTTVAAADELAATADEIVEVAAVVEPKPPTEMLISAGLVVVDVLAATALLATTATELLAGVAVLVATMKPDDAVLEVTAIAAEVVGTALELAGRLLELTDMLAAKADVLELDEVLAKMTAEDDKLLERIKVEEVAEVLLVNTLLVEAGLETLDTAGAPDDARLVGRVLLIAELVD